MSHLSHEQLWARASGEATAAERIFMEAHLSQCDECRTAFDDVSHAQAVLRDVASVPPLPDAMARRVGARLAGSVDDRVPAPWWRFSFDFRFAVAAATACAVVVALAYAVRREPVTPAPVAPIAEVMPPSPAPVPAPVVMPPPVAPPVAKKLVAEVTRVRRGSSSGATLKTTQRLDEGSTVSTEKGGALWLALPDGTKAGLAGATNVQLAQLDTSAVTFDVANGNLAMVVPHREDRVLRVRAGDVMVRDLGTRFLVSKDGGRVLVAVEEGSVEVVTPERTTMVTAGHAVEWLDDKLTALDWAPAKPAPALAAPQAVTSHAKLGEVDEPTAVQPPPTPSTADPDAEWNTPTTLPKSEGPPPSPPPETVTPEAARGAPPRQGQNAFSLDLLEDQIRLARRQAQQKALDGTGPRLARARQISSMAAGGDCLGALAAADSFFREPPAMPKEEVAARKVVLLERVRCFNSLGRFSEAADARVEYQQLR